MVFIYGGMILTTVIFTLSLCNAAARGDRLEEEMNLDDEDSD